MHPDQAQWARSARSGFKSVIDWKFTMVAKKYQPTPDWIRVAGRPLHPARNGSFRDLETQLEQLPMDAGRSPSWVFCDDTEDQFAQFPADWFSSNRMSCTRDPAPVQPKPSPVPPDDSLRRD
jgi:hypothetical protein